VGGRVDGHLRPLGEELAGERIELGDPLDLVAEELDPDDPLLGCRLDLERVAADPEPGPPEGGVVPLVLEVDEVAEDGIPPVAGTGPEAEDRGAVVHRRAEAVDARDRGDDDDVPPLEEGVGRRVAEAVDLVVPGAVLLDVRVGPRQVGLGLVVVEVADEVLDGVVGEELAELGVELGGEGLVVGEDEGRPAMAGDDLGDRVRLPRPGRPEEGLEAHSPGETVGEALDRLGLVAGRFEGGDESKFGHRRPEDSTAGSNCFERTFGRGARGLLPAPCPTP